MSLPTIYSVAAAAEYLDVDDSTVYRAIERGDLRASRIGAKRVLRITETALLEFLGEQVAP